MAESVLDGKRILAVDDESDILAVVEGEILDSCPNCQFDKATTYNEASEMLKVNDYDVVILDIMGVKGFDLLKEAVSRGFKTAMLTAHALSSEALKKSHDLGARAYLPKEKLGELVPFLEGILKDEYKSGWKKLLEKLEPDFDEALGPNWKSNAGITHWF
jgi:DNA-binding response OmpR family regulator